MTSYVALLRAVNVAGNPVKMDRLRAAFVAAGHDDVRTHIQSGNVLFSSSLGAAAARKHVEALLLEEFGKPIVAIMRTAEQLATVCANNPFLPDESETSKLYVSYLAAKPSAADVATFLEAVAKTDDEVHVDGLHAYIRYVDGAGRSKLTTGVWKKLGVEGTARNWNVTTKLAELATAR